MKNSVLVPLCVLLVIILVTIFDTKGQTVEW